MPQATLLIVDDEPSNLEAILEIIEASEEQYDVLQALDARRALEIMRIRKPDLVITDWEMPYMSGIEFIQRLKQDPSTCDLPVIMCSGVMTTSANLKTALSAGASDFIRKPIDEVELLARVSSMLQLAFSLRRSKRQKSEIEEAYASVKLLGEIGREITTKLKTQQIVETVYRHINSLIESDMFALALHEPAEGRLRLMNIVEHGRSLGQMSIGVDSADSFYALCFRENRGIHLADFAQRDGLIPNSKHVGNPMPTLFYHPLSIGDKCLGVISLQRSRPGGFSPYQVDMVSNLANYAAVALDNAAAYEKIEQQRQLLAETNATKDQIFSIIGHDLRAPVGNLETIIQLLQHGSLDERQVKVILSTAGRSARSAYSLLENLLLWARSQQNNINFSPARHDLYELARTNFDIVMATAQSKQVVLRNLLLAKTEAFFDYNLVSTTLRNLLSNAVKFTPPGGSVFVLAESDGHWIKVSVRDTGVGMKKEELDKIFVKGEHHSTYGTEHEKGSGLGLKLCIDFVRRNGGRLEAQSEPGHGSVFSFTLPLAPHA